MKRSRMRRVTPRRREENAQYWLLHGEYLERHPFCQISIAMAGADEAQVIANNGRWQRQDMPRSTQVHHRNKSRGARKNDVRWWMAASQTGHDLVEGNKRQARNEGFLLPLEATDDGWLPDGSRALETPALMALYAGRIGLPTPG